MWKGIAFGAATLAVLGTGYLSAQQPSRDRPDGQRGPVLSREDATAFVEARIAALHSGLQLTPDQERLWPAFEKAFRDRAKLRIDRMLARRDRLRQQAQHQQQGQQQQGQQPAQQPQQQPAEDPIARMQRRADTLSQEGASLKTLADAAAPLWQSFDDGQKRRFAVLSRPFGRQGERAEERGGRGDGRDGERFGEGRRPPGFGEGFGRDRERGREYGFGRDGERERGRDYGTGRDERDYGGRGRGFNGDRDGRGYGDREGRGYYGERDGRDYGRREPFGERGYGRGDGYGRGGGYERDFGRDYGRAPYNWRRGLEDRRWRDERGQNDGDIQRGPRGDLGDGGPGRDDEDRL